MILYLCYHGQFLINMSSFGLSPIELLEYQPNRYPFLMIDRVTDVLPEAMRMGLRIFL